MNDLQDVPLGRVVRSELAPVDGCHDLLKERPEDGRGDAGPIEVGGFKQRLAHGAVEGSELQPVREERAVDIRKRLQVLIEVALTVGRLSVQSLEELGKRTP